MLSAGMHSSVFSADDASNDVWDAERSDSRRRKGRAFSVWSSIDLQH